MVFEIKDKTFDITLVNNWVREEYQNLLDFVYELTSIPGEMDKIVVRAKEHPEEEEALLAEINKFVTKQRELTKTIALKRRAIVKELLESNEQEYDEAFWIRKCDVDDINDFMLDCLRKDLKEGKSSAKK